MQEGPAISGMEAGLAIYHAGSKGVARCLPSDAWPAAITTAAEAVLKEHG